ncbi:MAG: AtpZ/AtpI family protein [Candidatus Riflebacteria bacterium]|nr:AtpZ/AtpI family protein [Candidatus Riflebacteria bacterium]
MKKDAKSHKDIYGGITGKTINIGMAIGITIAICTFMGYEADIHFHCSPKGIIAGALFGIVAGFVNMWEQLKKLNQHLDKENEKRKKKLPEN